MTEKELGDQPAYPSGTPFLGPNGELSTPQYYGLSKREAFAMAAMQGILSCPKDIVTKSGLSSAVSIPKMAIVCAEGLLAELTRTEMAKTHGQP